MNSTAHSKRASIFTTICDRARLRPAPLLIALHGYGANKRQMMREAS